MILLLDIDLSGLLNAETISVTAVLVFVIYYFYNENKTLKNDIKEVIKEHKDDLREQAKTAEGVAEKYHKFMEDIKSVINYRNDNSEL